ncbi:MAG: FAD-dependent monooxygenase, partial [Pseudomonadota bacterium]
MEKRDVAIVGGGLVGPALACALAGAGFRVAVIDAKGEETRRDPAFDGRAYAVTLATQRLLGQIGVWEAVADKAQPIRDIHVSEGGAEAPLLHFDPRELEEGRFGWILADRFLRGALLDRMEALGAAPII